MKKTGRKASGQIRISGGIYRGRKVYFQPSEGLRPSTDMARQRLFNWLRTRTDLSEARVLDLFSGSGSVGLEALSRGALHVSFVESSARAMSSLRSTLESWPVDAKDYQLYTESVEHFTQKHSPSDFGVMMIDPPFALHDKLTPSLLKWTQGAKAGSLIYWECQPKAHMPFEDHGLFAVQDKTHSGVRFLLLSPVEQA